MKGLLTTIFCICLLSYGYSQLTLPPSGGNQKSMVTQHIGPLVKVTIAYSSPDVTASNGDDRKGKIWGQLVPHGFTKQGFGLNNPAPWRAGANEATVIKFSHDVMVEGKPLKAGKYAFFVATAEPGPWTVVFSKNYSGWGSYFYEEKDDALRVEVNPKESEYHEWLTFEFIDRQPNSTTFALKWENISLPVKVEVPNNNDLIVENLKKELIGQKGFTWTNLNAAANFCLQNNTHLEQGLTWADQSISGAFVGNENYTTLSTKAQILQQMKKTDEAVKIMDKAVKHATATVFQIHSYGRTLINQGQKEKALEMFEYNMERFGDVWPVRVGMARGLAANGKYKEALQHAKIAHERAPDQLNKNALEAAIGKLEKGEDIN